MRGYVSYDLQEWLARPEKPERRREESTDPGGIDDLRGLRLGPR